MKGKFELKGIKSTNPIWDVVDYELEESSDTVTGTIPHPRKKKIILSVSRLIYHQMHIIASNIDRVLLITINNPPTT
jgi:ribosome biogenesis GTPase